MVHTQHLAPCSRLKGLAGRDRAFRAFSVVQDQQSRELSQHHTQRAAKRLKVSEEEVKLPPVIAIDACQVISCSCSKMQPHKCPDRPKAASH